MPESRNVTGSGRWRFRPSILCPLRGFHNRRAARCSKTPRSPVLSRSKFLPAGAPCENGPGAEQNVAAFGNRISEGDVEQALLAKCAMVRSISPCWSIVFSASHSGGCRMRISLYLSVLFLGACGGGGGDNNREEQNSASTVPPHFYPPTAAAPNDTPESGYFVGLEKGSLGEVVQMEMILASDGPPGPRRSPRPPRRPPGGRAVPACARSCSRQSDPAFLYTI